MTQKKTTASPAAPYDGSTPLKDPKHEFFCELFTTNTLPNFWGNGSECYSFAFNFAERITELRAGIDGTKKMRKGKSKVDCLREIDKIHATTRACASRLLTNANVKLRTGYLLDKLAETVCVDRELTYLIHQRTDHETKMAAIQHYDKRMQRIREKVDIKHEFEPIDGFTYVKPEIQKSK